MRTRTQRAGLAALALSLGLGLTACGSDDKDATDVSATPTATPTTTVSTPPPVQLGAQVPGVIQLDGANDKLTRFTNARYGSAATLRTGLEGDARGFQRLCVGSVDVVDSSRPMTADEYAQCQAEGLDVVQFQVAADAVVLAIKSQTDVGADCISTDQIRTAFQNGSTVNNWAQLGGGFDNVHFDAGGPSVSSDVASFFGSYILGSSAAVTSDFRNDYKITQQERQTLDYVSGTQRDRTLVKYYFNLQPRWNRLLQQYRTFKQVLAGKQAELDKALANRAKGIRDKRPVRQKNADEARVQAAYADRAIWIDKTNAAKAAYRPINLRFRVIDGAYKRLVASYGRVGIFSEGFYATFEDQLRPFEVQVSDGDGHPNCIFPSPETILNGQYPLSRQILLTTTTRALGRSEVRDYLKNYIVRAQNNALATGLVALPTTTRNREYSWLNGTLPIPKFAIDPATGSLAEQAPAATNASAAPTDDATDDSPAR